MPEYVSKPQHVEAIQWTGENPHEVEKFAEGAAVWTPEDGMKLLAGQNGVQGYIPVPVGHWVLRYLGNLTDHWPMDPDQFARKYERVDAQDVLSRLSGDG